MYFVYRSHYEGPLSRRVRRLPDASVLDWFRRCWDTGTPAEMVERELGGPVYGLASIFEAARAHALPAPRTWPELFQLLDKYLYIEGDMPQSLQFDGHALRVKTDDDEVDLAYFLLDDEAAALGRFAFALHDRWPLPADTTGSGGFDPAGIPVQTAAEAGEGPGTVYAVFLTFRDGDSFDCHPPLAFPGVRLPGFAAHLRELTPPLTGWPPELLVLRALSAPGEDGLEPALRRCDEWPGFDLNRRPWPRLPDDHRVAHAMALDLAAHAGPPTGGRRADLSLLGVDPHLAQLSMHVSEAFGHQQWFLFDDVWAASHADLAGSLLRYVAHWDPLHDLSLR
ncbi:hypothetical protein QEZ54_27340 [Catellatospora sp. KI3]|uniref:hypothetical protein n=1 Tax=Catellatospora sp. KI3 TaxID=3041620 RepID=UPI002483274A|nr:hypothetical protein [Catellatospora sp. KI3]MDI1464691.1 hypothetical protein [Catellatospora sp. KI3]